MEGEPLPVFHTYSSKFAVNGLTVTVNSNNSTYDINLIGIMQNDKNTELPKTIANDLKGKTVTVDYDNVKTENGKTAWVCTVCGYVYYGEEVPEDYTCPICSVDRTLFKKQ